MDILLYNSPLKEQDMDPYFFFALLLITSLEPRSITQSSGVQDNGGTSCKNFVISGLETSKCGSLQATSPSL